MEAWVEIYSDYSPTELEVEIKSLKEALSNFNTSQGHGSLNWQRSIKDIADRLRYAQRLLRQKTGKAPVQNNALIDCSTTSMNNGACGNDERGREV